MKASFITGIVATLLIASCVHSPRDEAKQRNCFNASLDQVSVLDAIRLYPVSVNPVSNGPFFTKDSIPEEEMEGILVTVEAKDMTPEDYLQEVARAARLRIETKVPGLFRVTRPQK